MFAQILGPDGIIIAVVILVVLFAGGRKIPGLARSLGSAQSEFKKGVAEGHVDHVVAVVTPEQTGKDAALKAAPVVAHVDVIHQVDGSPRS